MQTYLFHVTGLHCQNCVEKVEAVVRTIPGVQEPHVTLSTQTLTCNAPTPLTEQTLNAALSQAGLAYRVERPLPRFTLATKKIKTFLPLIVSFSLVLAYSGLWQLSPAHQHWHRFMQDFMAGFFFIFGGLKALSWNQFAHKFKTYDILAARSAPYAWAYPGLELALGLAYATGRYIYAASLITLCIMLIGAVGIQQKLSKGTQLTCACIGGWFSVPLTKITIAENLLMAGMALWMLYL